MTQTISREEALTLLFSTEEEHEEQVENSSVFDSYGNYFYPSDIRIKEPNIAVGNAFAESYCL